MKVLLGSGNENYALTYFGMQKMLEKHGYKNLFVYQLQTCGENAGYYEIVDPMKFLEKNAQLKVLSECNTFYDYTTQYQGDKVSWKYFKRNNNIIDKYNRPCPDYDDQDVISLIEEYGVDKICGEESEIHIEDIPSATRYRIFYNTFKRGYFIIYKDSFVWDIAE